MAIINKAEQYQRYLSTIKNPENCKILCKLEFLNADGSVAFALDNKYRTKYTGKHDSRAFIADGKIDVSLNNGQRRKASIQLENVDNAFDYAVNKLWFGKQVRLYKGIEFADGTEFYISQGVFYLDSPSTSWTYNGRTSSYSLVDKWSYLDGSLFGKLESTYEVLPMTGGVRTNIFSAMRTLIRQSIYTHEYTNDITKMIDNVEPIFTTYYADKYVRIDGTDIYMYQVPKTITQGIGNSYASVLLDLNNLFVGWIGYDANGALRVDASQQDINDGTKSVLWDFTTAPKTFLSPFTEKVKPTEVFNDVIVWGEGLSDNIVGGRSENLDPTSDTNINLIGRKTYAEQSSTCYTSKQCADLSQWYLKRKTVLQKSITITASQLLHLRENELVLVQRKDKQGTPIERHLIQSYSLPLNSTGSMTITATSVSDFPVAKTKEIDVSNVGVQ